jgi:hypothetical protein
MQRRTVDFCAIGGTTGTADPTLMSAQKDKAAFDDGALGGAVLLTHTA